jgi:hypothetical protein
MAARGRTAAALLAILLWAAPAALPAQDQGGQAATTSPATGAQAGATAPGSAQPATGQQGAAAAPAAGTNPPADYTKEEFPGWARDLWRGEIIFFGSLPFSMFFTLEGYDVYRYAAGGFVQSQAPWPFRSATDIVYAPEEQAWLVASSLTLSLFVAVADFMIGRFTHPDEKR